MLDTVVGNSLVACWWLDLKSQQHWQRSKLLCYFVGCKNLWVSFNFLWHLHLQILWSQADIRWLGNQEQQFIGYAARHGQMKAFIAHHQKSILGFRSGPEGLGPLGLAQADALYGAYRLPPQFSIRSCPATRVFVRTVSQAGRAA